MLGYVVRRLLMAVPVMGVVALVVFSLLYLTPGDPAQVLAGDTATPEQIAKIRTSLGLDEPPVARFAHWLWHMVQGDLGASIFSGEPVTHMIGQRLQPTFSLLLIAVVISVGVGVPFGVAAAARRGGFYDHALTTFTTLGFSLPAFIAGYGLAYLFATTLKWLPVQGFVPLEQGVDAWLRNLILPATTLSLVYAAIIARVTRASMLEVLSEDYIRTARAKGVAPRRILFRHALKNAAVPVMTVIGIGVATLIGSAVITENVFAIPGIGRLTVDAILHRDYPIIQGVVLLLSAGYVLVNVAVDLCYTLIDPRIRY
ncbi:MAG TPA: ABC transporter permease [Reyranella sp.]|nr:ABC transporter permease [Reyranella sp.]